MKTAKKGYSFLSVVLTLCMLLTLVYIPVSAAGTLTPAETSLLAPKSGQNTYVAYEETLTTEGTLPAGVYTQGNKLVLKGSEINGGGTFKVNGQDVTLANKVYSENFEGLQEGAAVTTSAIAASTSTGTVAKEANGNKYANGTIVWNESTLYQVDLGSAATNAKYLTAKMKIYFDGGDLNATFRAYGGASGSELLYQFGPRNAGSHLMTYYNAEATYGLSMGGVAFATGWNDLQIDFDFTQGRGKYSIKLNGNVGPTNYLAVSANATSLTRLEVGLRVDDVEIYSGTPCGEPYTFVGSESILAPGNGKAAKLDYKVLDLDGNAVSGLALTSNNLPEGVAIENNSLVVFGSVVKSGTFTLKATGANGTVYGEKTVTVQPTVYFEDFEGLQQGASVANSSIASAETVGTVAKEENGNLYASGSKNSNVAHIDFGAAAKGATDLTIKTKFKVDQLANIYTLFNAWDGNGSEIYRVGTRTTRSQIINWMGPDGNQLTGASPGIGLNVNTWYDMEIRLNFTNPKTITPASGDPYILYGTYSVIVGGTNHWMDYAMIGKYDTTYVANNGYGYIKTLKFGVDVDDVQIYSGSDYVSPYTLSGAETLVIPEEGTYSKMPYTVTESGAAVNDVILSVSESVSGVKLVDGGVILSSAAEAGEFDVIAKNASGKIYGTKKVKIVSPNFISAGKDYTTASIAAPATIDLAGVAANCSVVTLKGEYKWDGATEGILIQALNADGTNMTDVRVSSGQKGFYSYWGTTGAYGVERYGPAPYGEWTGFYITLNLTTGQYTFYTLGADGYIQKMKNKIINAGVPTSIKFGSPLRNAVLYAGNEFSILSEVEAVEIPGAGTKTTALSAKYSDGSAVSGLTVSTEAEGFTANGANLTADASAALGKINVTLSDGFVSKTVALDTFKDYVLVNGNVMEAGATIPAGNAVVKVCYGDTRNSSRADALAAHYTSDVVLAVPAVGTTQADGTSVAEFTANLKAGEKVKAFLWNAVTLNPIRACVEFAVQ